MHRTHDKQFGDEDQEIGAQHAPVEPYDDEDDTRLVARDFNDEDIDDEPLEDDGELDFEPVD